MKTFFKTQKLQKGKI